MTNNGIAGSKEALERLEPCAGKLARTVLKGVGSSNAAGLPDFSFVGRQHRITLDNDHFYIDLVFYNRLLRSFILIDLKIGKLTHQDLGQMQMYVNYFDRDIKADDENSTVGIVLCRDKNEVVAKYTLPKDNNTIFASKYKTYLPTEDELKRELEAVSARNRGFENEKN